MLLHPRFGQVLRAATAPFRSRPAQRLLVIGALLLLALPSIQAPPPPVSADGELPFRSWHFAEGNSSQDFQTFFSVLNLSDQPANVMAHYNREDGIRLVQWFGVLPHARLSINGNDIVGPHAFGASFFSNQDIVVERSTTWGPRQNAETTVGFAPDGKRAWHFAEGTTRGRVSTYFVTQNLSDNPANVTATFNKDDGTRQRRTFTIAPRARDSFQVGELLPDSAFSASFTADQDIVVERTMTSQNAVGVLGGPGYAPNTPDAVSRVWSFAEGSTRRPYLTFFLIFNPNPEPVEIGLRFSLEGGGSKSHTLRVPALGRMSFDPRDVLPATDFATTLSADRPIVVERSYYSTGDGLYGALGYTPSPARSSSRAWYFAEGNTTGQIETFFLIANLTDQPTQVRASFFTDAGQLSDQHLGIAGSGRLAIRANDILPETTFSARFLADQNVLVERTFYFPGWSGFTAVGAGAGRP